MAITNYDNRFTAEENWLKARVGFFTASEGYKLLVKGKGDNMFGEGALTYIRKKAIESYTGVEEDTGESFVMKRGKFQEQFAHRSYENLMKQLIPTAIIEYFGSNNPQFFKHPDFPDDVGVSPDCIIRTVKNEVVFIAEYKSPNMDTHYKYMLGEANERVTNQEELKNNKIDYYTQAQMQLMTFGCDCLHWCSFNESFPLKDQLHLVEIKPDIPFQNNLKLRLKQAIILKQNIVKSLKNRQPIWK